MVAHGAGPNGGHPGTVMPRTVAASSNLDLIICNAVA